MLPGLISFLIGALFLLIVLLVTKLILDYMECPAPLRTIILLIVGLIGLLMVLGSVGHFSGFCTVY